MPEDSIEIDWVINIYKLVEKEGIDYVSGEFKAVNALVKDLEGSSRILTKAILETCYLTSSQTVDVCKTAVVNGTDFVKTSTGYGKKGAAAEVVKMMKDALEGSSCRVKASGGISTLEDALAMIKAGAMRLGTSHSKAILEEAKNADLRPYNLNAEKIAGMIDHSILQPDATAADVKAACEFAKQSKLACVVVRPLHADYCAKALKGSSVKTCFVAGFSLLTGKDKGDKGALGFERYNIPLDEKLSEIREGMLKIRRI